MGPFCPGPPGGAVDLSKARPADYFSTVCLFARIRMLRLLHMLETGVGDFEWAPALVSLGIFGALGTGSAVYRKIMCSGKD